MWREKPRYLICELNFLIRIFGFENKWRVYYQQHFPADLFIPTYDVTLLKKRPNQVAQVVSPSPIKFFIKDVNINKQQLTIIENENKYKMSIEEFFEFLNKRKT